MPEETTPAAQDDTAPAGGEVPGSVTANSPSLLDAGTEGGEGATAGQNGTEAGKDTAAKATGKAGPDMATLLDDPAEAGADGKDGKPAAEGEEYALTFPEGTEADPEAVKVLNAVGREFGVTGEKAQALATAATEYAGREVAKTIAGAEKRFTAMRVADKAETMKTWGADYDRNRAEAGAGLAMLMKAGAVPADIRSGELKFLLDKRWFLDMCRREYGRQGEGGGIAPTPSGGAGTGGRGGRTMLQYAAAEYERLVGNPRSKKNKPDYANFIAKVDEEREALAAELGVEPQLIPNSKQKEIINKWLVNGDWRWYDDFPLNFSKNVRRYNVAPDDVSTWKPFATPLPDNIPEFAQAYFSPRDQRREVLPSGQVLIEGPDGVATIINPDGSIEGGR